MKKTKYTKEQLRRDIQLIDSKAKALIDRYFFNTEDIFALGYMCGKYGLEKIIDNQDKVIEACRKYDETDDLGLFDTIGETLIDLGIIDNSKI